MRSPRLWTARELLTPGSINRQEPSKRPLRQHQNQDHPKVSMHQCPESPMPMLQQNRNAMPHTSRQAAQSHINPTDTLKPSTGHSAALQRSEIQPHWLEHWHQSHKPGSHHRALVQPHPQGQTPQLRRTTTNFIFFENHTVHSPYIRLLLWWPSVML